MHEYVEKFTTNVSRYVLIIRYKEIKMVWFELGFLFW